MIKSLALCLIAATSLLATDPPKDPTPTPTTPGTGVTSTNTSNSNIHQNFLTPASSGRQFATAPMLPTAQVQTYLGPWNPTGGSNVLDNLSALPEVITLEEAKRMYSGGVDVRVNRMADASVRFKSIKFLTQFPVKTVTVEGKEYQIPDETKFKRMAFINLNGSGDATTLDILAKGTIEATKVGANAILILKKTVASETSTSGWSIGMGGVSGQLSNESATRSQAGSFGTGVGKATAKAVYRDSMMILAVHIPGLEIK